MHTTMSALRMEYATHWLLEQRGKTYRLRRGWHISTVKSSRNGFISEELIRSCLILITQSQTEISPSHKSVHMKNPSGIVWCYVTIGWNFKLPMQDCTQVKKKSTSINFFLHSDFSPDGGCHLVRCTHNIFVLMGHILPSLLSLQVQQPWDTLMMWKHSPMGGG